MHSTATAIHRLTLAAIGGAGLALLTLGVLLGLQDRERVIGCQATGASRQSCELRIYGR